LIFDEEIWLTALEFTAQPDLPEETMKVKLQIITPEDSDYQDYVPAGAISSELIVTLGVKMKLPELPMIKTTSIRVIVITYPGNEDQLQFAFVVDVFGCIVRGT
jgi:hypothetical protein